MWWTYNPGPLGDRYPQADRYALFLSRGTGGQVVAVIPAAQMVVVHRGYTDNGRAVSGRDFWSMAEQIVAAREGEPKRETHFTTLAPVPFASQAPPVPRRQ